MTVMVAVGVLLAGAPAATADERTRAKSKYRGKYFRAELAPCREAIGRRESGFSYTAKNPTSSASGFYQFLDRY